MKFWVIPIIFIFYSIFKLSHQTKSKDFEPIARTPLGFLKGTSVDFRGVRVYQFLGIPYAEPPLNGLRFKRSIPKKPWNGVLHVDEWDVACEQPIIKGFNDELRLSEDCLVLNVFTTEAAFKEQTNEKRLRPVMIWIHGGSFTIGSANIRSSYDGTAITALHDVIIVTLNYRLGPLGFLYLPEAGVPGNMGLWDQQLALKWVKDNIEHFGGDPDQITLYGESSGSQSVSAQLVSPQSKGLFKNIIMQSGSIYDIKRFTAPNVTAKFLTKINCTSKNYKSCLSHYRYGQFPEAEKLTFYPISGDRFLPYSPEVIVENDGVDPNVNVLLGTVGNEGIFFLLSFHNKIFNPSNPVNMTIPYAKYIFGQLFGKKFIDYYSERYLNSIPADDPDAIRLAIAQALGDNVITCSTYAFGRDLVRNGVPKVYAYVQTQKPTYGLVNQKGWNAKIPTHVDDVAMIFGRPFVRPETYNVEDAFLSTLMMDIWTKFAKEDKPPKVSSQDWFTWGSSSKVPYYAMVLDSKRLGKVETKRIDFCLTNWPLPLDRPLTLEPANLTLPS